METIPGGVGVGQHQQQPTGSMPMINTRVLKEPRGMIRIIQLVFAILAFSITANFDTETTFTIACMNTKDEQSDNNKVLFQQKSVYAVEYPFDMSETPLRYLESCAGKPEKIATNTYDIDFSSTAQFFVATGVLCFLYTLACLYLYMKMWQLYETNPFFPVVDLTITGILTVFWLSAAIAWAANVSDIKYYTGPKYLLEHLKHCNQTVNDIRYDCFAESPGKWSSLYISLIFGFANIFIWGASMWFVYKETHFHRNRMQPQMMMPPQPNMMAGPMATMNQQQQQPMGGGQPFSAGGGFQ